MPLRIAGDSVVRVGNRRGLAIAGDAVYNFTTPTQTHVATLTTASAQIGSDLDAPRIPLDLSLLGAPFWAAVTDGGGDIRCELADGTPLPREVEACNKAGQTGKMYIFLPETLSSTVDTDVLIYIETGGTEPHQDSFYGRKRTWRDSVTVMHFNGPEDSAKDNDWSEIGNGTITYANGAMEYTDSRLLSDAPMPPEFNRINQSYRLSVLPDYHAAVPSFATLFFGNNFQAVRNGVQNTSIRMRHQTDQYNVECGTWLGVGPTKLDATWDGFNLRVYNKGVLQSTTPTTTLPGPNMARWTGGNADPVIPSVIHEGLLDSVWRSDDFIAYEYLMESAPLTAYSITDIGSGALIPNSAAQGQSLGNVTLAVPTATVTPDDAAQAQALEEPSLTQAHSLAPGSATQGQALDEPTLTQANAIIVQGANQGQTLDNVSLATIGVIAPDAAAQAQALDNVALTVAGVLAVQSVTQEQALGDPSLTQRHALAVQSLLQANLLDTVTLSVGGIPVEIQELSQGQALESVNMTQYHVLAVDALTQQQITDVVNLGGLVVGSLNGQIVAYAKIDGEITVFAAVSGSIHTIN